MSGLIGALFGIFLGNSLGLGALGVGFLVFIFWALAGSNDGPH
jgi:hypothetical protein